MPDTAPSDDLFAADDGGFVAVKSKAAEKSEARDEIGADIKEALSRYNAGQHRASITCMVDAINKIAVREKIYARASIQ